MNPRHRVPSNGECLSRTVAALGGIAASPIPPTSRVLRLRSRCRTPWPRCWCSATTAPRPRPAPTSPSARWHVRSHQAGRHGGGGGRHRVDRPGGRHHHGARRLRRRRPVRHRAAHSRASRGAAPTSCRSCPTASGTATTSVPPASRPPRAAGASLVITCDCGITALETVRAARAAGIGVVITDHHLPGAELPPALAVVDPAAGRRHVGRHSLCAAAASPSSWCRRSCPRSGSRPTCRYYLLDLVALATVADVVPLRRREPDSRQARPEAAGRLALARGPRAGPDRGLATRELRAGHCGFVLGPRLNAAGRIGDATDGLRLLLTDDEAEAD